MNTETETARLAVLATVPVRGAGRLVALAEVWIEIAGVDLVLRGVQVVEGRIGWEVRPPQFRDARGQWVPAVTLPPELAEAMHSAVLEALEAGGTLAAPAFLMPTPDPPPASPEGRHVGTDTPGPSRLYRNAGSVCAIHR